jgi:hypothetical protein
MQLTPIKPAFPVDFAVELTIFSLLPQCGNFFALGRLGTALNFHRPSRKIH